jgi:3-deoxy-7-phosphoheptulonate synthase
MKNLKLASQETEQRTIVNVNGIEVGRDFVVIAGPCSVESEAQILDTARAVKAAGADMLRGGAFKPRTSPYAFQGLGIEGLKILEKAKRETGLPIVTEVVDPRDVSWVAEFADVLQIGTRNMQNFSLLKEVGRAGRPVLLKRGITFETYTRNTLDLSAIPAIKELSHLPIIIDPTHSTGRISLIGSMSMAAVAAGADGMMVEVHPNPEEALCDADQALTPAIFSNIMTRLRPLKSFLNDLPTQ